MKKIIYPLSIIILLQLTSCDKIMGYFNDSTKKEDNTETIDSIPESEETVEEFVEEIPQEEVAPAAVDQPIIEQTPAVAASGNFHIIVGTFGVKENADRLVQKILDAGYDGKIITSTDKGHTVSFHSYNTKEEAANQISKASEITGTSAYVLKR
jgi:cell division protein FtsN